MDEVTCVVLCGGTSVRFGGGDKTAAAFGGSTVLDHLLAELPARMPTYCVGERRPTARPVTWAREDPPLGGPVAGIAAALALVRSPLVAVIAGDMPYAARALPALLAAVRGDATRDGAVALSPQGRTQPLLGVHRADALRAALPRHPDGVSVRRALAPLNLATVPVAELAVDDVDTRDDLRRLDGRRHD